MLCETGFVDNPAGSAIQLFKDKVFELLLLYHAVAAESVFLTGGKEQLPGICIIPGEVRSEPFAEPAVNR